jgi:hypothetical protein
MSLEALQTRHEIVYRAVDALVPYAANAREHSKAQVKELAALIRAYGFNVPVLLEPNGTIVAGHGRVLAAKSLGITDVPTIDLGHLTPAQRRAYRLADNAIGLKSTWNDEVLARELAAIEASGEIDLDLIGFSEKEIVKLLDAAAIDAGQSDKDDGADDAEELLPPVSRRGDLWLLGPHRVLCGDAVDLGDVRKLLDGAKPDVANCDPPYGIAIVKASGDVSPPRTSTASPLRRGTTPSDSKSGPGLGRIDIPRNRYAPIIGDESTDTAIKSFNVLTALDIPVLVLWGGNYYADHLPASRCWLVWDKENTGSFADAELAWTNQDKAVRLLRHKWNGMLKASERGERRVHPTQKPVALAEWVIETLAPKATSALDLFLGSGSTLIACERRKLACFGMELAPDYVDVVIKRWEKFSGGIATLDGRPFAAIAAERGVAAAA